MNVVCLPHQPFDLAVVVKPVLFDGIVARHHQALLRRGPLPLLRLR